MKRSEGKEGAMRKTDRVLKSIFRKQVDANRKNTTYQYQVERRKLERGRYVSVFFILFAVVTLLTPDASFGITDPIVLPYEKYVDGQLFTFGIPLWIRPLVEFLMGAYGTYSLWRQTKVTAEAQAQKRMWDSTSAKDLQRESDAMHNPQVNPLNDDQIRRMDFFEGVYTATKYSARPMFIFIVTLAVIRVAILIFKNQ